MIVVLMGVSGSGKSTVGAALGEVWGRPFFDGDDYHPPENIAKMAAGLPLNDDDRAPWLAHLRQIIDKHLAAGKEAILATSALKASHRQVLGCSRPELLLVHLHGSQELILQRMAQRNHFMPPTLLQSQFDTLEPPQNALVLDIGRPVAALVLDILAALDRRGSHAGI